MKLASSLKPLRLVCLSPPNRRGQGAFAQEAPTPKEHPIYHQLKAFSLTGGAIDVKGLVLKKDRVQLTLDGVVYLSEPVDGVVTARCSSAKGSFSVETPPNDFEKDNVKRLLGTDMISSDFKTAVFRFTDDTAKQFGQSPRDAGVVNDRAQKLAREMDARVMREIGANLSARVAISLLNAEKPGFFFAHFDGGRRGRFSVILDHQTRIPVANFRINAGEKGLIWSYDVGSLLHRKSGSPFMHSMTTSAETSRTLTPTTRSTSSITEWTLISAIYKDRVRLNAHLEAEPLQPNVRAITFSVSEDLTEYDNLRLKKQMRVKSVRRGGVDLSFVQEDWEAGFTVFLPEALKAKENLQLNVKSRRRLHEGHGFCPELFLSAFEYELVSATWISRPRHLRSHVQASEEVSRCERRRTPQRGRRSRRQRGDDLQIQDGPTGGAGNFCARSVQASQRHDQVGKGRPSDATRVQFSGR